MLKGQQQQKIWMKTFSWKDSVARNTSDIILCLFRGVKRGTYNLMNFCPRQNRKKCRDENFWLSLLSSLIWERPGKRTGRTCGHDIATERSLAEGIVGAAIMNLSHNWTVRQLETSAEMKRSWSSSWCQCDNELTETCFYKKMRYDIKT